MDVELAGCLRDIQTVLEKFIDRDQRLLIEIIRRFAVEYLTDEHFTERDRQLIDQTSDAKRTVCDYRTLLKENLADI